MLQPEISFFKLILVQTTVDPRFQDRILNHISGFKKTITKRVISKKMKFYKSYIFGT